MNDRSLDQEYLKSLTVLYVEDDEDTREQLSKLLQRVVGVLITATDGEEGLAAYHAHHPHLVITDIQMPALDGLSMARAIRGTDASVAIIVLTAFEQVDYLKDSINLGVDKYVTKPIAGSTFHETLLQCAHKLRAEKTLLSAATTDPLTGLINRRGLTTRMNEEKSKFERHASLFSVIIADIDHFKKVNDSYGHNAGDQVLKEIARTARSVLRAEDICGRWGGEEFLFILPETELHYAAVVAEKLRIAVSELSTDWEGKRISVTMSAGVVAFKPGMDIDQCIGQADEALYRAKANGRNRIELAESLPSAG